MKFHNRLRQVLTEVMGELPGEFTDSSKILDIPGMSSLVFIRFIVAIEKEFTIRFDTREIIEIHTLSDILKKLKS